jgi:hypothetical protein
MNWTPFYFEGNEAWGLIEKPEDWERIKREYAAHAPYTDLKSALRGKDYSEPRFGFYAEYAGPQTLGEWAKEQGMEL